MGSMGRHCGLGSMGAVNSRLDPVRRLECLPVSLWRVPLGQHAYKRWDAWVVDGHDLPAVQWNGWNPTQA